MRYLGKHAVMGELELRWNFHERWGLVAFGGAGRVFDAFDSAVEEKLRYAGGVGLRIRLSKEFALDFAVDGTINDEGEEIAYIYVGQRF